jgi:hypothetical protein
MDEELHHHSLLKLHAVKYPHMLQAPLLSTLTSAEQYPTINADSGPGNQVAIDSFVSVLDSLTKSLNRKLVAQDSIATERVLGLISTVEQWPRAGESKAAVMSIPTFLQSAAKQGLAATVAQLLTTETGLESLQYRSKFLQGRTALELAAVSGDFDCVTHLVSAGANDPLTYDEKHTQEPGLLAHAVAGGNDQIFDALLPWYTGENTSVVALSKALETACRLGRVHVVEALLVSIEALEPHTQQQEVLRTQIKPWRWISSHIGGRSGNNGFVRSRQDPGWPDYLRMLCWRTYASNTMATVQIIQLLLSYASIELCTQDPWEPLHWWTVAPPTAQATRGVDNHTVTGWYHTPVTTALTVAVVGEKKSKSKTQRTQQLDMQHDEACRAAIGAMYTQTYLDMCTTTIEKLIEQGTLKTQDLVLYCSQGYQFYDETKGLAGLQLKVWTLIQTAMQSKTYELVIEVLTYLNVCHPTIWHVPTKHRTDLKDFHRKLTYTLLLEHDEKMNTALSHTFLRNQGKPWDWTAPFPGQEKGGSHHHSNKLTLSALLHRKEHAQVAAVVLNKLMTVKGDRVKTKCIIC